MIVIIAALAGALIGGFNAKRRGGNGKDIAHYAVVYAMIFAIIGMVVAVTIDRVFLS